MSKVVSLRIESTDGAARAGTLSTPHGSVATPAFMPVATQASVKALTSDEVGLLGAEMVLANTYHLMLRPGAEVMQQLGGLHDFMRWPGPILTDSGGYQIYSLGHRVDVSDDAVAFRSHLDGSLHVLSPERAVAVQESLGADIIMALDHLTPQPADHAADTAALDRTLQWAARCRDAKQRNDQALFGIVQGGLHLDLRERAVRTLEELGFPGYGIGGLSVGESKAAMHRVVDGPTRHAAGAEAALPHGRWIAGRSLGSHRERGRPLRLRVADALGAAWRALCAYGPSQHTQGRVPHPRCAC